MRKWLSYLLVILSCVSSVWARGVTPNRVLSLDGDGDYVETADSEALNAICSQVTIEAWIRPTEYTASWMFIVYKGDEWESAGRNTNFSYVLSLNRNGNIGLSSMSSSLEGVSVSTDKGLIMLNEWFHVAGVIDAKDGIMTIFINGVETVSRSSGKGIYASSSPLRIGWNYEELDWISAFSGQMDEVRVWNVARSQDQIRETMYTRLSGNEQNLVGYWQFDDTEDVATDSSPIRSHGKLMGDARFIEAMLPNPDELMIPTLLSGVIIDELGKPVPDASVRLEHDDTEVKQVQTNESGQYWMAVSPRRDYDLSAVAGDLGNWQLGVQLSEDGEHRSLNLELREAISISGTLLMLDDTTPHVDVNVQATRDGKVVAVTSSDRAGKYRFVNLKPGLHQLRCCVLDGYVYYEEEKVSKPEDGATGPDSVNLIVKQGKTLKNMDIRFPPFKKGIWRNYTSLYGLARNEVTVIYRDPEGIMWFGTDRSGVSRYDGREFVNFTEKDGLAGDIVTAIHGTSDGTIWFGTINKGVSRYDGKEFVNLTIEDGLAHERVDAIYRDPDGITWFGTGGGVSRYDGEEFVNLTTEDGLVHDQVYAIYRDPDGVMWFGTYGGVSRYDGKEFSNFTTKDGLVHNCVTVIHRDPDGMIWFGTGGHLYSGGGGGISRYDGKEFINLTTEDGLANSNIGAIYRDSDGIMWFGTHGGVSRYDGNEFINFTAEDGLAHDKINAIHGDPGGVLWFGTSGGVSRYDGKGFVSFTSKDGLVHDAITSGCSDTDGVMWLGTRYGVSRYDGKDFVNFTSEDGLINRNVNVIYCAPDGVVWFGTEGGVSRYDGKEFVNYPIRLGSYGAVWALHRSPDGVMWFGIHGGGLLRYDGEVFESFTEEDGLKTNWVKAIYCDPDGVVWVGLGGGVSRYDGEEFVNFTTKDGVAHGEVRAIHRDANGIMWFGTDGGVNRYDGEKLASFTTEDGLAHNSVVAIYSDADGNIWFGTEGGGVSCYDGIAWTSLDTRDGLAGDSVAWIHQDSDGFFWFGTDRGLTRYRKSDMLPKIHIVSVTADRSYSDISEMGAIKSGTRVTVEYRALDFKTVPEKQQYRYRIRKGNASSVTRDENADLGWYRPTKEASFDWIPEKPGTYTFQVQAIDRDLNYSQPASLELNVVSPLYLRTAFLIPVIGSGAILLAVLVILSTALIRHRQQVHAYQRAAVQELRDAREMQLGLLPEVAPKVEGIEIAGRSITANTVGGDFYDYLTLAGGEVGIAIGDISGKGLKAAMNAAMANGMLHEVAVIEASCGGILSRLNAHLYPLMERQMFTAFSFAILDTDAGVIQWSNAAQPLPLIKRDSAASEVKEDGELPLGMIPDVVYPDYQLRPQPGDIVIFYTDGIIEAENEADEMYGTERLLDAVAAIDPAASAEGVIEAILHDVDQFVGTAEQYDDMTIVVVKTLEKNDAT